jgi:hypothetical protein
MQAPTLGITYRGVAILRPGSFVDANGRSVSFTEDSLQLIADNYDPAYHCAVLNLDHNESGPAQGFVSDLAWDGAHLLADISGVPPELTQALGAGRYPFRSAEVYADLDGRGPYLRAVALLGARPPAVKGLPPMPEAENVGAAHGRPAGGPWASPTNTNHLRSNTLAVARRTTQPPHIITVFTEVSMPTTEIEQAAVLAEPALTPVPAAPVPPSIPVAVVSAPAASTDPDGQGRPSSNETIRLAEENQRLQADAIRLAEENRALKDAQRKREVRYFLAELRRAGQLTPALERAGVEQALIAAAEQPLAVTLPDGGVVQFAELLRDLLKALPVSFALGEAAPATTPTAPALSADDQAVMAALGLSAEEYAGR